MGRSDAIETFLLKLLQEAGGACELQRGELAEQFSCVPSQINYVLTTRFTPEHGYIVESRRGGGGYIRITRVTTQPTALVMHTVNAVGDRLDPRSAQALLQNLVSGGALPVPEARLIAAALSESALRPLPLPLRDIARAGILKQCLLETINN
ncbi:MAG: CtsR family transcriptional regulator [Oscillospiraceae bacterium]|jgi:transcriptional regulator CtsR|nr:CtsR family transcriptional regulator [Oscillospiraceae bacterium]